MRRPAQTRGAPTFCFCRSHFTLKQAASADSSSFSFNRLQMERPNLFGALVRTSDVVCIHKSPVRANCKTIQREQATEQQMNSCCVKKRFLLNKNVASSVKIINFRLLERNITRWSDINISLFDS